VVGAVAKPLCEWPVTLAGVRDVDYDLVHGGLDVPVDLVPVLGDDRDLVDLVQKPFGQRSSSAGVASRPAKTPKFTRTSIAGSSRSSTMNAIGSSSMGVAYPGSAKGHTFGGSLRTCV
jgi:hypothetical protein